MLMPEVALELAEAVLVPLSSDLRVALGGLVQHVPAIFPELLENCCLVEEVQLPFHKLSEARRLIPYSRDHSALDGVVNVGV